MFFKLFLAVAVALEVLPTNLAESVTISQMVYEVVSYDVNPSIKVTFNGVGSVNMTITTKKGTTVLDTKDVTVTTTKSPEEMVFVAYPFTQAGQSYDVLFKIGTKSMKITITSDVEENAYELSSSKTFVNILNKVTTVSSNRQNKNNSTYNFYSFFKQQNQNAIFDLSKYPITLTDATCDDMYGELTFSNGLSEEFCKDGKCSVNVKVVNDGTNNICVLDGEYYYDGKTKKMTKEKTEYKLKNPILEVEPNSPIQLTALFETRGKRHLQFNFAIDSIIINRPYLYGSCETSLFCIVKHDPLKEVEYEREIDIS